MNIVQVQDQLKNFSQDQLIREMQAPSGTAPQYLVLGEIMRRQRMQADFSAQQSKGEPQASVAEEAVVAAGVPQGGIADMARALAPKTDMAQNTGAAPVQAMATGGLVTKMAKGDAVKTDPAIRAMANRAGMSVEDYLDALSEEEAAQLEQAAGARAARARMVGFEPLGDSITMPTQADLDRRYAESTARPSIFPSSGFSEPGPDLMGRTAYEGGAPPQRPGRPTVDMTSVAQAVDAAKARGGRGGILDAMIASGAVPASSAMYMPPEQLTPAAGTPEGQYTPRVRSYTPEQLAAMEAAQPAVAPPIMSRVEPGAGRVGIATALPPVSVPMSARRAAFEQAQAQGGADPLAAMVNPVFSAMGDFGGALVGRTVEEQAAIDAQRAAEAKATAEAPAPAPPTPEEAAAIAAENAATAQATAEQPMQTTMDGGTGVGVGSGGGGGGGTGIAGAGGVSSYEKELMDALARREKAASQDKWLALAQVGLNLMSSTQPTLLGAVGEAGLKGVEAARSARDQYDKDRLELLGAVEQSRAARAAAAARAAGGEAKPKELPAGALDIYDADIAAIDAALMDLSGSITPEQKVQLQRQRDNLASEKARLQRSYLSQYGIASAGASPAAASGVYSMDDVSE